MSQPAQEAPGKLPAPSVALRLTVLIGLVALAVAPGPASGANTEPTLALMRATAVRGASGRTTLTIEGSFSFADAVQLALPLTIVVTQGSRSARYDLTGTVSVSIDGGAPQAAPAPGVLGISDRSITLVLPTGFSPGEATAQIVATYEDKAIASNALRFTL
jgi:hypothetical protein